jgi:hypothetical protein
MIEETSEKLNNRLLHTEGECIKKKITLINIGSFYLPFQKSIPELELVHAEHNYFNMLFKYIRAGVICKENTGQALINIQVVPPNNTKCQKMGLGVIENTARSDQ